MKNLYFIRHGQSEANVKDMIGGRDWRLTPAGKKQAVAAGADVVKMNMNPDVIVSSPMLRAYDTAKAIAKALEVYEGEIEVNAGIQERFFGELENKHESAFGVTKEYYLENPRCIDHFKDVETIRQLHKRATIVLTELKNRPENIIFLVSHAAFGRSLKKVIDNRPFDEPTNNFDNAKIIKLI